MPTVSIIVPVYNVENKIRRCLDSIAAQSFTDFECILVDDGSPDHSGEICEEYASRDKRFQVIHRKNAGVSAARNVGIDTAKGQYIAFCDSDDYVNEDYLEALIKNFNFGTQLAVCGVNYRNDINDSYNEQPNHGNYEVSVSMQDEENLAQLLEERRFNYVYGKLYMRDILEQFSIRFDPNVSLGEDTIFVMDYLSHTEKVSVIGKPYYNYLKYSSGTLTRKFYKDIFDKFTYINNYIERTFQNLNCFGANLNHAVAMRRVDTYCWAVEMIRHADISNSEKENIIQDILNNIEIQNTLKKYCDILQDKQLTEAILAGDAKRLLRLYNGRERKERLALDFKRIVVKVVPYNIRKLVKRCLSTAQS